MLYPPIAQRSERAPYKRHIVVRVNVGGPFLFTYLRILIEIKGDIKNETERFSVQSGRLERFG